MVEDDEFGMITETIDLSHPLCPIVIIESDREYKYVKPERKFGKIDWCGMNGE